VVFAISFGVAKSLNTGSVDILSVVLEPLLEVVFSLALGFIMGLLFTLCERVFFSEPSVWLYPLPSLWQPLPFPVSNLKSAAFTSASLLSLRA
jgi:hypothetical protein